MKLSEWKHSWPVLCTKQTRHGNVYLVLFDETLTAIYCNFPTEEGCIAKNPDNWEVIDWIY